MLVRSFSFVSIIDWIRACFFSATNASSIALWSIAIMVDKCYPTSLYYLYEPESYPQMSARAFCWSLGELGPKCQVVYLYSDRQVEALKNEIRMYDITIKPV